MDLQAHLHCDGITYANKQTKVMTPDVDRMLIEMPKSQIIIEKSLAAHRLGLSCFIGDRTGGVEPQKIGIVRTDRLDRSDGFGEACVEFDRAFLDVATSHARHRMMAGFVKNREERMSALIMARTFTEQDLIPFKSQGYFGTLVEHVDIVVPDTPAPSTLDIQVFHAIADHAQKPMLHPLFTLVFSISILNQKVPEAIWFLQTAFVSPQYRNLYYNATTHERYRKRQREKFRLVT